MKRPTGKRRRKTEDESIAAIILAAGPRRTLPFPKALAPFGTLTALERALKTCAEARGFAPLVVVLGSDAEDILGKWEPARGVIVVRNQDWREGQLSSLLAGLRRVSPHAAFLIYPVDYPLLFPGLLARLRWAYTHRSLDQRIVVPSIGKRDGHPVLVAPELRREFSRARTAREVVHRPDKQERVLRVRVRERAIFRDFDSPATYRLCVRLLRGHQRA
ncbi:MAG TPA: NTP transferase domain-containing protein [Candidatus Acidoferrales bacterium]|nr:NTP transferase domain-containing protein [Candidatus Acidoferrales bacterium]